jgi:hypothetical protein
MPRASASLAGSKTRIQNASTQQTVKNAPGLLRRIILSNGGGTARTLTVNDGATTLNVLNIAANDSFASSIKVTPSHADVDALVIYD